MRFLFPILTVVLLVISCFLPWMTIESRGLTISGMRAESIGYGKPAYLHYVLSGLYLLFLFINRTWSRSASIVFATLNIAWAVRNFFIVVCPGGDCPLKRIGLYLLLLSSIAMFIAGLLVPLKEKGTEEQMNKE